MNSLIVFNFDSQEIRFVDGQPVGVDVARVLGYKDPSSAIRDLVSPNNKRLGKFLGIRYGENKPRIEEIMLLKEAGIYQLIFKSKLPSAEKFQDWVFEEVLPSIRKTGQYSTNEFKEIRKPHLSIDDIEMYIGMAERLTKISHDQFRSTLEDELFCLVKLQCQSEGKPLDHLYTKILDKAKNGISPSQLKSYVWELRKLSLSEVHIILRTLCDLGLGYIKPQKRSYLFFRQD